MRRRNKIILIFTLFIVFSILSAVIITLKDFDAKWYKPLFYVNIAVADVLVFIATIDKVLLFIGRIIGPDFSTDEEKQIKNTLNLIKVDKLKSSVLEDKLIDMYTQEIAESILEKIEENEFVRKKDDFIRLTQLGNKYINKTRSITQ